MNKVDLALSYIDKYYQKDVDSLKVQALNKLNDRIEKCIDVIKKSDPNVKENLADNKFLAISHANEIIGKIKVIKLKKELRVNLENNNLRDPDTANTLLNFLDNPANKDFLKHNETTIGLLTALLPSEKVKFKEAALVKAEFLKTALTEGLKEGKIINENQLYVKTFLKNLDKILKSRDIDKDTADQLDAIIHALPTTFKN